jgi:AraC-like DNA-binding protein
MTDPPSVTKLLFQDLGDSGLGRISAATRQVESRGSLHRRIDCFALVYTLNGRCRFWQEQGPSFELQAGHAFVLFPGALHTYGPMEGEEWDELYMLFEGPVFELWRNTSLLNITRPVYHLEPVAYWESRIMKIWEEEGEATDRVVRLQTLLADMNRERDKQDLDPGHQQWLKKARYLLAESAAKPNGAQLAAHEMGESYQTFRKTFSRLQGCGPARYRTEQVLQSAARTLLTEDTPIKQIAQDLGFCDEFHFSRRFKQCIGSSPASYRRRASRQR